MKVLLLACVAALAALAAADNLKVVDDFDFVALLNDKNKWKSSFECFLGKTPCGDQQELKDGVAKRLESKCADCTPKQLEKYNRVLKTLKDTYPEDFKEIMKKYSKN